MKDRSGAAIQQATVFVDNLETGVERRTTTDNSGRYIVLSLSVGRYAIRVQKQNFQPIVRNGITLVIGQQAVIDFTLDLGELQQQVTVTEQAPLVDMSIKPDLGRSE